jgi:hypothetical protein
VAPARARRRRLSPIWLGLGLVSLSSSDLAVERGFSGFRRLQVEKKLKNSGRREYTTEDIFDSL